MKTLLNVEKSAFRRGEYVGYCHGVWQIKPDHCGGGLKGWRATRKCFTHMRNGEPFYFVSHTLEGISAMLAKEESTSRIEANF